MTVAELVQRFPEIPSDLHNEAVLVDFVEAFEPLLVVAAKPSACSEHHTDENKFYLKLVGPMDIYRYGLFTRERVLDEIQKLLNEHRKNPDGFAMSLLND